ncbi:MAG TPA: zf-HC2 domain-containing protein [Candidatus Baltobacteraceae bacterium]|nr:zf-HC2 domain-containing protein [Candidatus Baltobacteraceae bacterium]
MSVVEHVGELAELYALGTLSDAQRARVDVHVNACEECAARIGEAEAVVAALVADVTPPRTLDARMRSAIQTPRSSWWIGALAAAAFVLGLLPSAWLWQSSQSRNAADQNRRSAIVAMLHSHFTHAQFVGLASDAPKAKALFARGKTWCYVVAQTNKAYDVRAESGARSSDLGRLHVSGDTAELFVPSTDAQALVLLDGARPVARVTLPYRR